MLDPGRRKGSNESAGEHGIAIGHRRDASGLTLPVRHQDLSMRRPGAQNGDRPLQLNADREQQADDRVESGVRFESGNERRSVHLRAHEPDWLYGERKSQ